MTYSAQVEGEEGEFTAVCPELGRLARGFSAGSALEALRRDIRFPLELCPCSPVEEAEIELEVRPG